MRLLKRALKASEEQEERDEKSIGFAAAKFYELLWNGEYTSTDGKRLPIQGDTSKMWNAIGLTRRMRAL